MSKNYIDNLQDLYIINYYTYINFFIINNNKY